MTTRTIHLRAKSLFDEALGMDPSLRDAWLRAACAGDQPLLSEVVTLLAHHDDRPLLPGVVKHVLAEVLRERQSRLNGGPGPK